MAAAGPSTPVLSSEIPFASVRSLRRLGPQPVPQKEVPLQIAVRDLNPFITCGICLGYLYEAATITECMHTFCKSCIVKHTEVRVTCPLCEVIIHPTDPLCNIKLDRTLQDIVGKLLPSVVQEENRRRETFYSEWRKQNKGVTTIFRDEAGYREKVRNPKCLKKTRKGFAGRPKKLTKPLKVQKPLNKVVKKPLRVVKPPRPRPPPITVPLLSLVLECVRSPGSEFLNLHKKFVRVRSDAKISDVKKFLHRKLDLHSEMDVCVFCEGEEMETDLTLADIERKFLMPANDLLLLSYTVACLPEPQNAVEAV